MRRYSERQKSLWVVSTVITFNVITILGGIINFWSSPALLSVALLAYLFGLRHAVDADHIAAIDNATRKLMNEGKTALSSGMFFSLGHASVVIIACLIFAVTTRPVQDMFPGVKETGSVISTFISGAFLIALAVSNAKAIHRSWRKKQFILAHPHTSIDELDGRFGHHHSGFLTRLCAPLFRMVNSSYKLFFIGFLFGIGFDTATEVAIFSMSVSQASQGEVLLNIMFMPLLFTAGMMLIDSFDGIMMSNLYKWAQIDPLRKVNYNICISSLSVIVAALIGAFEILSVFNQTAFLSEGIHSAAEGFISEMGWVLISFSIFIWGTFYTLYRLKKNKTDIAIQ